MKKHVERILSKFAELTEKLSDEAVFSDPKQYSKLAKERADMEEIVSVARRLGEVYKTLDEDEAVVIAGGDAELVSMAKNEIEELEGRRAELEEALEILLVPRDPADSKNTILEIRAGTGGEEANLFAADLMRMYTRYAEEKGWRIDVLSSSPTGIGGFKEVIFLVEGKDVFGTLKYERGVHRVQRVPVTEASGRIHTSAVSVAVLAEAEEIEVEIDPKDLRIDVFRASGPGGQNVNKVETAVRVTHIPSGIVVSCQDEKSQHKNKEKALKVLRARLLEKAEQEQDDRISQERKSQIGSGDRSAKIRTYNYPQQRVTDHRIGLTLHRLDGILDGDLGELIEALRRADVTEKIKK